VFWAGVSKLAGNQSLSAEMGVEENEMRAATAQFREHAAYQPGRSDENPQIVTSWCMLVLRVLASLDRGERPLQVPCSTSFLVNKRESGGSHSQCYQPMS